MAQAHMLDVMLDLGGPKSELLLEVELGFPKSFKQLHFSIAEVNAPVQGVAGFPAT